ncbi:MAG: TDP-N-acetylfucosamine:lipid II N-acetylfucosaminyltransferase [Bacteroidales bacterium]|nr:TDP-N-acetylfucosamine:lipid II N-acetylfucosaminyltransferase [Bacteroidales bacterium]
MYFHVFYGENGYSKALLELLENHIDLDNHIMVFGFYKEQSKNAVYSGKINTKSLLKINDLLFVLKNIQKADWIYIHFLQYNPTLLYWALNEKLLKKSTWIVWGSDLYSYYKKDKNLKTRIYEFWRRKVISELPEIAVFAEEEFNLIKKLYETNAEYAPILYPIPINISYLDRLKPKVSKEKTVFLLGNSGDKSNLHYEMINLLTPFSAENIEIICPLSYGADKEYQESVIRYGTKYFGDKFIPLVDFMGKEEYSQVLGSIDVALMNHKRQQGLGNILALLYLGKKVFMRTDVTSYAFLKNKGCELYDITQIKNFSFTELMETTAEIVKNKKIVKGIISKENYLNLWLNFLKRH